MIFYKRIDVTTKEDLDQLLKYDNVCFELDNCEESTIYSYLKMLKDNFQFVHMIPNVYLVDLTKVNKDTYIKPYAFCMKLSSIRYVSKLLKYAIYLQSKSLGNIIYRNSQSQIKGD